MRNVFSRRSVVIAAAAMAPFATNFLAAADAEIVVAPAPKDAVGETTAPDPETPKASEETATEYYLSPSGVHPFVPEYERWFGDDRRRPHRVRNYLEAAGLQVIGEAYYWALPSLNSDDWVFPNWYTRFTDMRISFDNNMHRTNHLLHPFAGSMTYWFSRSNGLS